MIANKTIVYTFIIWEDDEGRTKYHLVKWEEVKKLVRYGDLGIRLMVEMNMALHDKWLWKYLKGDEWLWKRVVNALYRRWVECESWCSLACSHGLSLWRKIGVNSEKFSHYLKWQLKKGDKLCLWVNH